MSKKSNFFDKFRVVMTKQLIYLTSEKKLVRKHLFFAKSVTLTFVS